MRGVRFVIASFVLPPLLPYLVSLFLFLSPALFLAPAFGETPEKELLGEDCYRILHDDTGDGHEGTDEKTTKATKQDCLAKLRGAPLMVVTPLRREEQLSRSASAVSVITQEEIERSGPDSAAELLRDVPGIDISDAGQAGQRRIRIRGEDSRRVAVLIDGQIFADEREVGTPLLIAPEMIDRIEVVRGSGSVLYGSRAIGGVVNFITKKGGYHPIQGTLSSLVSSATEGFQEYASLYGKLGEFSYRVAGAYADHNDRDTARGDIENTSYDNSAALAYLAKSWNNHELALNVDAYNSSSQVYIEPIVRFTPPFRDFRVTVPERDRRKAALFYTGEDLGGSVGRLRLDIYYQESDRQFDTFSDIEIDLGSGPVSRQSGIFTASALDTVGANGQVDLTFGESNTLIAGYLVKNDELDQERREEVTLSGIGAPQKFIYDSAEQTAVETFLQDSWEITEEIELVLGTRGYWVETSREASTRSGLEPLSRSEEHAVGAATLRYGGIKELLLWGGWSQGFASPSLVQLSTGAFAGPSFVNPNLDLDSESSNSVELGGKYESGALSVETAAFATWAEDYIEHVLCGEGAPHCAALSGPRDRVYANIDSAFTFGSELSLRYSSDLLTPYLNAAWLRRRYEREAGSTYDTGLPAFSGKVGLQLERQVSPRVLLWSDLFVRAATGSEELTSTETVVHKAGWGTVNLALGAELGQTRSYKLSLEILNLGDKFYTEATENIPGVGLSALLKFVVDV